MALDSANINAESCVPWKAHKTKASHVRFVGSKRDAHKVAGPARGSRVASMLRA